MPRFERSGALDVRWKSTISICLAGLAVTAALTGGEQTGGQAESRIAGDFPRAPLRPSVSPPLRPFSKAISFAILEDYDKGTPLRKVAADFALFKELGVPVWRGSFGWDDYEPARGHWDLAWLDRFATLADTMGISLRPYLGYTPEWAARGGSDENVWNDPPRREEDWARFVDVVARKLRRHRSILSYEIYNEENVPLWWDGTPADYARVLGDAARAVRHGDPGAQVLLGGMVWPDVNWLEHTCDGGHAVFDVVPFHAYPETWTPDSVTVENYLGPGFGDFLSQADRLCGRKPVWINEAGFATSPGKTERQQAEWWARAFATFLAAPRVEHLGIYEIRDQQQNTPVIGDSPNYYLGLIRRDGGRKVAFETVKLLVRLFKSDSITVADSALAVRVTRGKPGKLYQHLFVRRDGSQVLFLWDRTGSPVVEATLPREFTRVTSYDLDGRGTEWRDSGPTAIRGIELKPGVVRIFETSSR
jgi:polysaccharide biosynthesis protein PslG